MERTEIKQRSGKKSPGAKVTPAVPASQRDQPKDRNFHGRARQSQSRKPEALGIGPRAPEPPELDQRQAQCPPGIFATNAIARRVSSAS